MEEGDGMRLMAITSEPTVAARPAGDIRAAMREAFDGFGTGWTDADRVRVVQAAVGGRDAINAVSYIKAARDQMVAATTATTTTTPGA